MAVTTATDKMVTVILEDGSSPTGAGGNIINQNFANIAQQFGGQYSTGQYYANSAMFASSASRADWAQNASYANEAYMAYSVSGSGSTSGSANAEFAKAAGYANPESHAWSYAATSDPIAVWGNQNSYYLSTYFSSPSSYYYGTTSFPTKVASLPNLGPFLTTVSVCCYRPGTEECIFAKFLVGGWNLNIVKIECLSAFDRDGNTVNPNVKILSTPQEHIPLGSLGFYIYNSRLSVIMASSTTSVDVANYGVATAALGTLGLTYDPNCS